MSAVYCPCGFEDVARGQRFTARWHAEHRDHHLAVWPNADADQTTRDNLAQSIRIAEQREVVVVRPCDGDMWGVYVRGNFISDHLTRAEAVTAADVARRTEEEQ